MNRGMLKKRIAVIMSAACVLTVIPTPAFAAELTDTAVTEAFVDDGFPEEAVVADDETGAAGENVSEELFEAGTTEDEAVFEDEAAPEEFPLIDGADEAAAEELFMDITDEAGYEFDDTGLDDESRDIYAELWNAIGSNNEGTAGTKDDPQKAEFGVTYAGYVYAQSSEAYCSYYKFTVPKAGRIRLDTWTLDNAMGWYIRSGEDPLWYDPQLSSPIVDWTPNFPNTYYTNNTIGPKPFAIDLIPGDYYMVLTPHDTSEASKTPARYSFHMTFIELIAKAGETLLVDSKLGGANNTQKDAIPIELNKQYLAQSTADTYHENDWYQFTPKKSVKLYITASTQQAGHVDFEFVDGNGYVQGYYGEPPLVEMGHGVVGYPIVLKSEDYQKKMRPTTLEANKTYYIRVKVGARTSAQVQAEYTGGYRFMFSTKKQKPVKSVKISAKELQLTPGSLFRLNASVSPKTACDTGVTWYTDDQNVAIVDYETGIVQIPDSAKAGSAATITVRANLPKVNYAPPSELIKSYAEATCKVTIVDGAPLSSNKICDPIVTKQKVALDSAKFFGTSYKKYVVTPKECGSVSKGVFKSKNSSDASPNGMVTITAFAKSGKKYMPAATVSFRIITPEYRDKTKKGKPVKTYTFKEKTTVSSDQILSANGIKADKWTLKGKAGKFELDEKTGAVKILDSGSCKITAWYGEDKNAAKYTFTLKAKLPK